MIGGTPTSGRDPLRQRFVRKGGTPMRGFGTIVGLTGLMMLRVVLIGEGADRWVLWQEELRPSGGHRWTPVGTDPDEQACEALKRYLLEHLRQDPDVRVTDDMITQIVPGGRLQSRLFCLPQSVHPRSRR